MGLCLIVDRETDKVHEELVTKFITTYRDYVITGKKPGLMGNFANLSNFINCIYRRNIVATWKQKRKERIESWKKTKNLK